MEDYRVITVRCPHCEEPKKVKGTLRCSCGKEFRLVISKQGVIIHDNFK